MSDISPWIFSTGFLGGVVFTLVLNYGAKVTLWYFQDSYSRPKPPTVPRSRVALPPAPSLSSLQAAHSHQVSITIPDAPKL